MPKSFTRRPSTYPTREWRTGARWRDQDIALLRQLVEANATARTIAHRLGRTRLAVYRMVGRLGLTSPRRGQAVAPGPVSYPVDRCPHCGGSLRDGAETPEYGDHGREAGMGHSPDFPVGSVG